MRYTKAPLLIAGGLGVVDKGEVGTAGKQENVGDIESDDEGVDGVRIGLGEDNGAGGSVVLGSLPTAGVAGVVVAAAAAVVAAAGDVTEGQ